MKHALSCFFALLGCSLALSSCGRNGDPEPDAFNAAREQVSYGDFVRAAHFFERAVQQTKPGSQRHLQALFGYAASVHQSAPPTAHSIALAKKLYQQVIALAPDSIYAAHAWIGLGRIAEVVDYNDDPQDLAEARRCYSQIMQRWPNSPLANEAAYRIASAYVQTYNDADARHGVKILLDWLQRHAPEKNPLASAMWQYLGDTYFFPLNDYPDAVAAYIRADDIGLLERGREGPIYWKIAVIADRLYRRLSDGIPPRLGGPGTYSPPAPGDPYQPPVRYHGPVGIEDLHPFPQQKTAARTFYRDIAKRYYEKVIIDTPKSGKAYDAQQRLIAMGYQPPPIPQFGLAAQQAIQAAEAAAQQKNQPASQTPSDTAPTQPPTPQDPHLNPAWLNVPPGFTGPDSPLPGSESHAE